MIPQIRLQLHQKRDLAAIRDLGAEALCRIIEEIKKLPPEPVPPAKLQDAVARALGGSREGSEQLLRQVLSLHGLLRNLNIEPRQVFAALRLALQPSESGWSREAFQKWNAVETALKDLFELEVIRLSAKALDLSYEHPELLQRARILTDIRPVFNDDATALRGTVISHTLMLRYDDTQGDHVLSLSLDEDDIRLLIQQCERAITKSKTAQNELRSRAGIRTIVPGMQENDE
jgi:hypothetical protein